MPYTCASEDSSEIRISLPADRSLQSLVANAQWMHYSMPCWRCSLLLLRSVGFGPAPRTVLRQGEKCVFQTGAADFQSRQLAVTRQQLANRQLSLCRVQLDGFPVVLHFHNTWNSTQYIEAQTRDAANFLARRLRFDFGRRSLGHDLSLIDDSHTIGKRIRFLQVMGRQQNSLAALHQLPDFIPQHATRFHIKADRGFIQEKQIRIAADRKRKQHALLLSPRQFSELTV